jgi:hypothetical protein
MRHWCRGDRACSSALLASQAGLPWGTATQAAASLPAPPHKQALGLEPLAGQACGYLRRLLLFHTAPGGELLPDTCTQGGLPFLLVYAHVMLGLLLPLMLTYW